MMGCCHSKEMEKCTACRGIGARMTACVALDDGVGTGSTTDRPCNQCFGKKYIEMKFKNYKEVQCPECKGMGKRKIIAANGKVTYRICPVTTRVYYIETKREQCFACVDHDHCNDRDVSIGNMTLPDQISTSCFMCNGTGYKQDTQHLLS